MKQYDILLAIKGELVWVCEIFADEINEAITAAIEVMACPAEYTGHKVWELQDSEWKEVQV